jgi:hypothetical protein
MTEPRPECEGLVLYRKIHSFHTTMVAHRHQIMPARCPAFRVILLSFTAVYTLSLSSIYILLPDARQLCAIIESSRC